MTSFMGGDEIPLWTWQTAPFVSLEPPEPTAEGFFGVHHAVRVSWDYVCLDPVFYRAYCVWMHV